MIVVTIENIKITVKISSKSQLKPWEGFSAPPTSVNSTRKIFWQNEIYLIDTRSDPFNGAYFITKNLTNKVRMEADTRFAPSICASDSINLRIRVLHQFAHPRRLSFWVITIESNLTTSSWWQIMPIWYPAVALYLVNLIRLPAITAT